MKIQIAPIQIGDINTNEITIENSQKIKISFLSYCGIITNFEVPDVNGSFKNIVLCPKDRIEYKHSLDYGNIIILRCDKTKTLDMREHLKDMDFLSENIFLEYDYETFREKDSIAVVLKSDIIYKGDFVTRSEIEYRLDEENNFVINYKIESEIDTYINIFNNISFNLLLDDAKSEFNHQIFMPSDYFYTISQDLNISKHTTRGTVFDFSQLKKLNEEFDSDYEKYNKKEVYNTLFELKCGDIEPTVSIYDDKSKRLINITTDNKNMFMNTNAFSQNKDFVNIRFHDFSYDEEHGNLECPLIKSGNTYKKFINFNFKIM